VAVLTRLAALPFLAAAVYLFRTISGARRRAAAPAASAASGAGPERAEDAKTDVAKTNAAPGALPLKSDANWARSYALFAAVLTVWMVGWPYAGDPFSCVLCAAAVALTGYAVLRRRDLAPRIRRRWPRLADDRRYRRAVLLVAAAFGVAALEIPWNTQFPLVWPHALLIEYGLILLALAALYFLNLRHAIAPAVLIGHLSALGIIQAFVLQFKNAVLMFGDIFAAGTAMAVGGGYEYHLDSRMLWSMVCACAGCAVCALIFDGPDAEGRVAASPEPRGTVAAWGGLRPNVRSLVLGLGAFALLVFSVLVPSYEDLFHIKVQYWWEWQIANFKSQGFLPSFIAEAQDLPIDEPAGYSSVAARNAEDDLITRYAQAYGDTPAAHAAEAQYDQLQPSIVVVMNETFTDLSSWGDLGGYEGPTFFKTGMPDALSHGKLAVSVNGGGTCNTEFEFLTGTSMAFVGNGKYPYTLYDLSQVEALPRRLAQLGYETCAIHPNLATNWDRDRVYKEMGFDTFLDIDDFEGAEQYHNATSDAATYDRVIEQLENDPQPQFIFDVTMQNHSGYDQGGIPADVMRQYKDYGSDQLNDDTNALIQEYLACIGGSDEALGKFVGELRELDRPVLLVFFGDHQPYFTDELNDAFYPDEDPVEHDERLYLSDYVVWANYDVAGSDQADTDTYASASDLAARSLAAIGVPLTDHQKAELGASTLYSQLNLFGYRDTDGAWHDLDDRAGDAGKTITQLSYLAYRDFALRTSIG